MPYTRSTIIACNSALALLIVALWALLGATIVSGASMLTVLIVTALAASCTALVVRVAALTLPDLRRL
jgi:uncharacterized membrane protein